MLVSHRKTPNRTRELRERVAVLVRERIGAGVICRRCGATFGNYADRCEAGLAERCPGFNAIDLVRTQAEREVGLA
jgi:ribosomal protein L40E